MDTTVSAWDTALTPLNASHQALPEAMDTVALVLVFLDFIITLVGLAGNTVVLWLLGFSMQKNAFSIYVLNLAGADILLLSLAIIEILKEIIEYVQDIKIAIPDVLITASNFSYIAGLGILSAISTERCLSVLCPIWHRCHRPRHTSAVVCALIWALSLLLSTLEGKFCALLFGDFDDVWCKVFDFITAAWLIFLFVILSGSSLALVSRLFCGSQRVQLTRLYMTIILTVLVFLLCGLPFGIYYFLIIWISVYSRHFYMVALFLTSVNSCANPFIYFFIGIFRHRRQWQRQTFKLILKRAFQDIPEVDENEGSFPQETLEMSGVSQLSS
ncbi:PREDICTED: mas-related G-protein coupled receptor member X2-like [Condylura cristata]|uniref:mas-related G-protein coupled receptor member X2-like n=1 Tax=Condylura cristata TaxID=143302 RepID=UPI0003343D63|nr:PREDICTED: mas-related G-protein coupled receptor member X2-like [Condylura cristata]